MRQFDIAVCLDLPLFSFCVKSECYSENDRQCVGTSAFPCPPTSAILATYFCRRAVEMCRDLWREGERRCDFASLSQNCELGGFRTIVIPVFESQCAKSFLQRGWKEDGYATLRLLHYCKGEYKDACKLQHFWVNKISRAVRGQSLSVLFQVYACMMVFFLSNMIENQCMSTGAFEITLNGEAQTFSSGSRGVCVQRSVGAVGQPSGWEGEGWWCEMGGFQDVTVCVMPSILKLQMLCVTVHDENCACLTVRSLTCI